MSLTCYTSVLKATFRIMRGSSIRLLWIFFRNFVLRNVSNMRRFKRRLRKGKPFFPAFMMISVTETCNLACSGCWVSRGGRKSLTKEQIDGIINQSKSQGSYFFGILGGEPLLYNGLIDILAAHKDCYFQVFTNATLITPDIAQAMARAGNITPLVSIEGLHDESDRRRGRTDVFDRTMRGVQACRDAKLIFGAAASICKSNFHELVTRRHLEDLAGLGAAFMWYYIYRPVGADPHPENALDKNEVQELRRFIVEQRCNAPLFIIDTYWGADGKAMCPGATGMSHHISPSGAIEFCPPLQMACEHLTTDAGNMVNVFNNSEFLAGLRDFTAKTSRGCVLLEDPKCLAEFLRARGAVETTSRATFMQELDAMTPHAGHDMRQDAIPEKNPLYRWLQKNYFFGFGAYG